MAWPSEAGGKGKIPPPNFGRYANPISIKGTDYAHHIITYPPGFSNLPTALHGEDYLIALRVWGLNEKWFEGRNQLKIYNPLTGKNQKMFLQYLYLANVPKNLARRNVQIPLHTVTWSMGFTL